MKKGSLPWIPMYVDDYDSDTVGLTCEQDGAYWRLLRRCWKLGCLPDDDIKLAGICGVSKMHWIRHIAPAVRPYFNVKEPGTLTQKRLELERGHAKDISEKRAESARKKHERQAEKSGKNPGKSNKINDTVPAIAKLLPVQVQAQVQEDKIQGSAMHCVDSVSVSDPAANPPGSEEAKEPPRNTKRADVPSLSDGISKWETWAKNRHVKGVKGITEKSPNGRNDRIVADRDAKVWGFSAANQIDLRGVCRTICRVALKTDPHWRGDWETVVRWFRDEGWNVETDIIPGIEEHIAWRQKTEKGYRPPHWLLAFETDIRRVADGRKPHDPHRLNIAASRVFRAADG